MQNAEKYGFEFALSMIKLRGFGGKSEFWDYNLESFTLMAGLAAVTTKIKLFASTAVLTLPPAMVARMATTIDSISNGRFGINIVSGWAKGEYDQMGMLPGDAYFSYRYEYSTEYVQVMKDLWDNASDFKGKHFTMTDCQMKPQPAHRIELVAAGQSPIGMDFAATHCDYNFVMGMGVNTPTAHVKVNNQLLDSVAKTGRDVGAYVLFMAIADGTDEKAMAKGLSYKAGVDVDALAWTTDQGEQDKSAADSGAAKTINLPEQAVNFNMGAIVGSYATCAKLLDEAASVSGSKGIMLTFDDFVKGIEDFGTKIQPLMKCRADKLAVAA